MQTSITLRIQTEIFFLYYKVLQPSHNTIMKKFVFVFALLFNSAISFSNYWQPYPINYTISSFGTLSRLELSVWDSVLGSWQYYNTPYFNTTINPINSSPEIVVFNTYFPPNFSNKDAYYGFITYDPVLHSFRPKYYSNPDPHNPGAVVSVSDNVVATHTICCMMNLPIGQGFDIANSAYTYDINFNEWRGGTIVNGIAPDIPSTNMMLGIGGYLTWTYNDYNYNPTTGVGFYTPHLGEFTGKGFYDCMGGLSGNQDALTSTYLGVLSNDISSTNVYDPNTGLFRGIDRDEIGTDLISGGLMYKSFPSQNLRFFAILDDSLGTMKIDTVVQQVSIVKLSNRVGAYVDTTTTPTTVHYLVFSPTIHEWVKDSSVSINGVSSLNITNGTVAWIDHTGATFKAGYNDTIGWGNFDTPIQLLFQVTNMFPTMGKPLVFVRDYTIGGDIENQIYFGDGYVSTIFQGSAWHQYKINGNYGLMPMNTFNICMEATTPSGIVTTCKQMSFTSSVTGGNVSASPNSICNGDTVLLVSSGTNGPIQWQYQSNGAGWVNITGTSSNSDSLFVNPTQETFYRVKVDNGIDPPSFSNVVSVYVVPTTITSASIVNDSLCKNTPYYFAVDSFPGMTSFNWSIPGNWSGSSTSSTISFVPQVPGGVLSVSANTVCGTTTPITANLDVVFIDTTVILDDTWLSPYAWMDYTTYSWIDCTTGATVGNDFFFEPTQSGSYACLFQFNGCTDTSSCWQIILSGVESLNSNGNISVSPNPTNKNIKITGNEMSPGFYKIKLSDVYGQLVTEQDYVCTSNNMETEINLSEFSSGIYFLRIDSKSSSRVLKVVKE